MAAVVTVVVVGAVWRYGLVPAPRFSALAAYPDPTFSGTVAFLDESGCLRVVPAGGGPVRRTGFCDDRASGVEWTPDGKVAIESWRTEGQLGVDPATGATSTLPSGSTTETGPDRVPRLADGREVEAPYDDEDFRARIVARSTDGREHTLVSVRAPADYSFETVAVSPDGRFLLAVDSDGRVLVGRPDDSDLRLLATGADPYIEPAWSQPDNG